MFKKLPSIEQLHTIAREALKYGKAGNIKYAAKIKLHGTNAAVIVTRDKRVLCQKRTGLITPEKDNFDFAKWVDKNKEYFLENFWNGIADTYVHGEWAGVGIQKSDAVSQCPKNFYIFMVEYVTPSMTPDTNDVVTRGFLTEDEIDTHPEIKLIPIFKNYILNFFNKEVMDAFVEDVTKDIEFIGKIDPYIKAVHGVEGQGEGLVFYPMEDEDIVGDTSLMFKLKTEAHMENKRIDKVVVSYTPEQVKEIEDLADKYCTEVRYNQALTELGIRDTFSIKDTGKFIGWVCRDVYKECPAETEFNGFLWKDLAAVVTQKARHWFLTQVK